MLGWLRTYLERGRRRSARAAKMAAESAEMAALLTANAPPRSGRKTKWFGLVKVSRSRNAAMALASPPPQSPRSMAPRPMAPPTPSLMPAQVVAPVAVSAAPPPQMVHRPVPPAAAMPPRDASSGDIVSPGNFDTRDPELYGPPPPRLISAPGNAASPEAQRHAAAVHPAPPPMVPPSMVNAKAPAEDPVAAPVHAVAAVPQAVAYMPATSGPPLVIAAPASRPRAGWLLASVGWVLRLVVIVALIAGTLGVAAWPVWRESQRIDVEILPLAVPADLAARGIAPEVAAGRLLDALEAVAFQVVDNARNRPTKDDLGPIPMIAVTPERVTLRALASLLRQLRGLPMRRISGDITESADKRLTVRLRVPGGGQIASAEGAPGEDVTAVLAAVAPDVWRRLQPLVYAWYLADGGGPEDLIRPQLVALAQDTRLPPAVEFRVSVLYMQSLVRSGRAEDALASLEPLARRGANYPLYWNVKAQALADLGRTEPALEAQKQAVAQEGTTIWSHISSAHLLMKLGRPRDALTDLQSARRLQPNNFDAVMLEGMVLLNIGRPADALRLIGQVYDARPNLTGVNEALGSALLANGRPDEAIAAFDMAIARNPNSISTRLARANALRALRRPEEALATIDAVLALSPRDGRAVVTRGWTLIDLGRNDQALGVFDLLLKERPEDAVALHGKAITLAALGRRPEAIGILAQLVEMQPANRRAVVDLARLRGVPPPPAAPSDATTPATPTPPARQ